MRNILAVASALKRLANHITSALAPVLPVLIWSYLALVSYVVMGTYIFPIWWKTFLLGGGIADGRFWTEGVQYLLVLVRARQPLGVTLVVFAVLIICLIIYSAGRRSAAMLRFASPPRKLTFGVTLALILSVASLTRVEGEYTTETAYEASLERWVGQLHAEFEQDPLLTQDVRMSLPPTGLYLFIDTKRVSETYKTLQPSLAIANETVVREGESSRVVKGDANVLSGEAGDRSRLQTSVEKTPSPESPARDLEWLLRNYNQRNVTFRIFHDHLPQVWQSTHAIALLTQRGVSLDAEQRRKITLFDAEHIDMALQRQNVPILYHGWYSLRSSAGNGLKMFFSAGEADSVRLAVTGIGDIQMLDRSLLPCVNQIQGCMRHGNVLAIAWRSSRSGAQIEVDVIPFALW